jgi:NAD(P)-dependent dehydrogenase (short-subunit alcohol dehydrogenase family)
VDLELTGRRAVVTGGSRGIGLAVARALAGEGADVALVARGEEALRRAAEDVAGASGRKVVAAPADTGDDASVAAMVGRVVAELGGVDTSSTRPRRRPPARPSPTTTSRARSTSRSAATCAARAPSRR